MRIPFLAVLLLAAALVSGCAVCPAPLPWQDLAVADIESMPQDPAAYAEALSGRPLVSQAVQEEMNRSYDEKFFAPWAQAESPLSPDDAFWGVASYGSKQGYGENMLERPREWMEALIALMQRDAFPSLARSGIALRNADMRVMPTDHPFFYDFHEAGEGFPFDYFQNSALWAGTPLFVSHVSTDHAWYFVETGFASGWVRAEHVAFVDQEFMDAYRTGETAALLRDAVAVSDLGGQYRFTAHVGAVFPLVSVSEAGLLVNVPASDGNGRAVIAQAMLSLDDAAPKPLACTADNVGRVASAMAGQLYGWGGLFENRDCSAMVRDLFAPFGIWLPRNSTGQGSTGRVVSLESMTPEQKERAILTQGVPFASLVWMRGHIMLYMGEYEGRAAMFHNIWGLRTVNGEGATGRNVIGRAVVTTLTPGLEIDNLDPEKGNLLDRVLALAILDGS